jgi:hypothetical protein
MFRKIRPVFGFISRKAFQSGDGDLGFEKRQMVMQVFFLCDLPRYHNSSDP